MNIQLVDVKKQDTSVVDFKDYGQKRINKYRKIQ